MAFKVNFKKTKGKFIELKDVWESKGQIFNSKYKGKMPAGDYQRLRMALMTYASNPMMIDEQLLEDILNMYFTIEVVDKDAREFELADAIVMLSAFMQHTDKIREKNKKK